MRKGEKMTRGLKVLVFALTLGFLTPSGFAHVKRYAFNQEYQTIPQGQFEVEQYTGFKVPSRHRTNKNEIEYQTELEYGLTDHWTLAHYERWKTKNVVGGDDSTVYTGFKFETKYRIGERGKYVLDPLLYLEWVTDPSKNHNKNAIEGKIILSKDIEKFNLVYNQIMESALGSGGRTEQKFTAGINYELFAGFRVGMETKGDYWRPASHRNRIALGPSLSYDAGYFWVAASVLLGLNHAADDLEARVVVGIPFEW